MASVNKVIFANRKSKHHPIVTPEMRKAIIEMYVDGSSIPMVAKSTGISQSAARYHIDKAGALRTRAQALKLSSKQGRLGAGLRGKKRTFTQAHKYAIKQARIEWAEKNAVGLNIKPNGYIEVTRGEYKGKSEHVVLMEQRLGRSLLEDEVVHHIDGDRQNNNINNLALCTRSGHTRLHRFQDGLEGKKRERKEDGTWL